MRLKVRSAMMIGFMILSLLVGSTAVFGKSENVRIHAYYVPLHYIFNGEELDPPEDQKGFIYKGSTYVPLRFIAYSLNKGVRWDGKTNTVRIMEPTKPEQATIQTFNAENRVENTKKNEEKKTISLTVLLQDLTYYFDNKVKNPPAGQKGILIKGRLFVPLRFLSEGVGSTIDWNPDTYTITTSSTKPDRETIDGETPPSQEEGIGEEPSSSKDGEGSPPPLQGAAGGTPPVVPGSPAGDDGIPSYASIISQTDSLIAALKASCERDLLDLAVRYIAAAEGDKAAIIAQGQAKLAQCDAQFESIMSTLQTQLTKYEYSTSIINQYREEYSKQKADALDAL